MFHRVLAAVADGMRVLCAVLFASRFSSANFEFRFVSACPHPSRYAYVSQRGFYPDDREKANQDAYGVATNYDGDPNKVQYSYDVAHILLVAMALVCLGHLPAVR